MVSDLVEVIPCNIMDLSQVIHLWCFHGPPNENIRDFMKNLNNKIFPQVSKKCNSILCCAFYMNPYNSLHLASIDEFVNSLSGEKYFPFILRLVPGSPVTKYYLLDHMLCNYSSAMIVSLA